jgi:hypothetical protein
LEGLVVSIDTFLYPVDAKVLSLNLLAYQLYNTIGDILQLQYFDRKFPREILNSQHLLLLRKRKAEIHDVPIPCIRKRIFRMCRRNTRIQSLINHPLQNNSRAARPSDLNPCNVSTQRDFEQEYARNRGSTMSRCSQQASKLGWSGRDEGTRSSI